MKTAPQATPKRAASPRRLFFGPAWRHSRPLRASALATALLLALLWAAPCFAPQTAHAAPGDALTLTGAGGGGGGAGGGALVLASYTVGTPISIADVSGGAGGNGSGAGGSTLGVSYSADPTALTHAYASGGGAGGSIDGTPVGDAARVSVQFSGAPSEVPGGAAADPAAESGGAAVAQVLTTSGFTASAAGGGYGGYGASAATDEQTLDDAYQSFTATAGQGGVGGGGGHAYAAANSTSGQATATATAGYGGAGGAGGSQQLTRTGSLTVGGVLGLVGGSGNNGGNGGNASAVYVVGAHDVSVDAIGGAGSAGGAGGGVTMQVSQDLTVESAVLAGGNGGNGGALGSGSVTNESGGSGGGNSNSNINIGVSGAGGAGGAGGSVSLHVGGNLTVATGIVLASGTDGANNGSTGGAGGAGGTATLTVDGDLAFGNHPASLTITSGGSLTVGGALSCGDNGHVLIYSGGFLKAHTFFLNTHELRASQASMELGRVVVSKAGADLSTLQTSTTNTPILSMAPGGDAGTADVSHFLNGGKPTFVPDETDLLTVTDSHTTTVTNGGTASVLMYSGAVTTAQPFTVDVTGGPAGATATAVWDDALYAWRVTLTLPKNLTAGTHTFTVTATGSAGAAEWTVNAEVPSTGLHIDETGDFKTEVSWDEGKSWTAYTAGMTIPQNQPSAWLRVTPATAQPHYYETFGATGSGFSFSDAPTQAGGYSYTAVVTPTSRAGGLPGYTHLGVTATPLREIGPAKDLTAQHRQGSGQAIVLDRPSTTYSGASGTTYLAWYYLNGVFQPGDRMTVQNSGTAEEYYIMAQSLADSLAPGAHTITLVRRSATTGEYYAITGTVTVTEAPSTEPANTTGGTSQTQQSASPATGNTGPAPWLALAAIAATGLAAAAHAAKRRARR